MFYFNQKLDRDRHKIYLLIDETLAIKLECSFKRVFAYSFNRKFISLSRSLDYYNNNASVVLFRSVPFCSVFPFFNLILTINIILMGLFLWTFRYDTLMDSSRQMGEW